MNSDKVGASAAEAIAEGGAETARLSETEILNKLVVASDSWLWTTDAEHNCISFSENVEAITGVAESDLIGNSHINFVKDLAESDPGAEDHLEDLLAYRAFKNFEYDVPGADPQFSRMSISGVPMFVDGIFKGYCGIGRNISAEPKPASAETGAPGETAPQAGEAQRDSHADSELQSDERWEFLEELNTGIAIFDSGDGFVYANARHDEILSGLTDLFQPGKTFAGAIATAIERESILVSDAFRKDAENGGLDGHAAFLQAKFSQPGSASVLEWELADGRWVRQSVNRRPSGQLIVNSEDISDLKAMERELSQSRAGVEAILDTVPAGILVFDKDDRFVVANRHIREALPEMVPAMEPGKPLRYSLELAHDNGYLRVSGDKEIDELYDRDREAWIERYSDRYHVERRVSERQNPDGSWVQTIDCRNIDGTFVGVRLDITERKAREEEAAAANSRLQNAIDALKDGFVVWDADDRLVVCNDAFKKQVPEEMRVETGRTYRELLTDLANSGAVADIKGREEEWVQDLLDKRDEELGREIVFESHDGRWIMRRDQVTSRGERVGIRADITDVKRSELELQVAREETDRLLADFRTLIDTLELGVVLVNEDLTAEIINTAFYKIWRYRREDVSEGCKFRDLMDINRANGIYTASDAEWEDYVVSRCEEIRQGNVVPREFVRADGVTLLYSVTSLSGGKRLVTYLDISDQKERERALEEAQKKAELADRAKSEFLANMSHEIRTPMNGVLGMAELLAKSELSSKQKTFTDIIVKSGNALLTIINDILDFSKIDAGQLQLDPAPFKLAEAIEDVATLVSTRAKEKDLELIVRVQPGLPENMIGDVGRIRQIITNLMGNAVKFTEKGHVLVEVAGESRGNSTLLRFSVTDTGIGIPEDQLATVFEKFSQVDSSSTRRHEGTGLGLTITSKLVELMGGTVGAQSKLGEGSTFWFEVELENSGTQSNEKAAPIDVTGAKILIVDDNAVNRSILLEQTASWSFDACAAESGEVGLLVLNAAFEKGLQVECIILDYQMPGMTGFDVARIVRNDERLSDTPIVMLTSVDQALSTREYRDLGIDAHLVKPARSSQLLETLVDTIQAHRSRAGKQPAPEARPEDSGTGLNAQAGPMEHDSRKPVDEIVSLQDGTHGQEQPQADPAAKGLVTDESGNWRDERDADAAAPMESAAGERRDLDILVAEDNEVNQIVFTQILDETGYSYEIVGNGRLAVEAFGKRNPAMILMDVSMPEMNGLEATGAIREIEAGSDRRTPIVGVTAHALKGDRERCIDAGMDDYLSKPISPDALQGKIAKWLEKAKTAEKMTG